MPKSLEQFADDVERAKFVENQGIQRAARAIRAELRDTTAELARVKKRLDLYERIDDAAPHIPKWPLPKTSEREHVGIPCLELADIHYGAVIKPAEINGINEYSPAIAAKRLKYTCESTVKVAHDYLKGVRYEGLQLFLPGDMFSGEIHAELRETNAESVVDSIVGLLEPLEAGINLLAEAFGVVKIACVVGNHSRRTRKPIAKKRVQDNYDYLLYRLLARDFANSPKVKVSVSLSPDFYVEVYKTRYLLTHGDQFKGGSGISAELAPLLLGVHRKMRRDAASGKPFDIMVGGHFHRSLMLPEMGLIIGPSLMGYDEFAFLNNFKPEAPGSAFWLTTPERGVTTRMPIYAEKGRG